MGLTDRLVAALRAWDARVARQTEAAFNQRTGRRASASATTVREVGVADAHDALRPEGRPLLEHHTVLSGSVSDLPTLAQLAASHDLDVRLVLWDAVRGAPVTLSQVEAWLVSHGAPVPTLLLRGAADSSPPGLGPTDGVLPHTRLIDRDGGVLRVWRGPLAAAEARAVISAIARPAPAPRRRP